ncbi:MAG: glucose-1-phosphate thymidylyltransferase [Deltaproteobacteria bacterium]|nr:glucose-1-phosphate thymidylyltransferase [Deltaproteobacteria bacterium]
MKAIVLCAGLGTRLRPLTFSNAKHLIPVANKPVLDFSIESLVAAGAGDVGIVVNGDSRAAIESAIGDGSRLGARVTYIEQPQPRGLAHACLCAEPFIGADPFLMYLGDTLLPEGLAGPTVLFRQSGANAVVMLKAVDDPNRYGIAEIEGERIVRLVEKPQHPKSNLAIVGGYVFDRNIFDSIRRIKPSSRNEYEIADAIQDLIERDLVVRPYILQGWWKDTGNPQDLLDANRAMLDTLNRDVRGKVDASSMLEGQVVIDKDTEVSGSRIHGPSIIGAEVRIINSEIGPYTSLGDRVRVVNSRVENSVVMDDSIIIDLHQPLVGSLIGRKVRVYGGKKGSAHRLLLGDACEVELS